MSFCECPYTVKTISFFNPSKIALSGQAFRIHCIDESHVELTAKNRYLQICNMGNNSYAFSCTPSDFDRLWYDYFDLSRNYEAVCAAVDPADKFLNEAVCFGNGIRILRQEPFETLISYIISQRRSIKSISTAVERISETWGSPIDMSEIKCLTSKSDMFSTPLKNNYFAFPSEEQLASASHNELLATGVGYRAPYITEAVKNTLFGSLDTGFLNSLSDEELYEALLSVHGVGKKVANCVMLFGYGRTGRFPVDIWMSRILSENYCGKFNFSNYPSTCGIMQQFMFFYERSLSKMGSGKQMP